MKYEDFVRRQKTSAYAFDEELMKSNGECSLLFRKSLFCRLYSETWRLLEKLTFRTFSRRNKSLSMKKLIFTPPEVIWKSFSVSVIE